MRIPTLWVSAGHKACITDYLSIQSHGLLGYLSSISCDFTCFLFSLSFFFSFTFHLGTCNFSRAWRWNQTRTSSQSFWRMKTALVLFVFQGTLFGMFIYLSTANRTWNDARFSRFWCWTHASEALPWKPANRPLRTACTKVCIFLTDLSYSLKFRITSCRELLSNDVETFVLELRYLQ